MASLHDGDSSFLEAVPQQVQIRQAAVRRRPIVLLITPVAIVSGNVGDGSNVALESLTCNAGEL